jgi:hypothetical protein
MALLFFKPGPPGVGSRCTTYAQIPPGCAPRLQRGSVVAWSQPGVRQQQPRALLEDTGLQSRPTTGGSTETPTTDEHVCASDPTFRLSPGPVQPASQSPNYGLDRPGCDTRPLRRDMSSFDSPSGCPQPPVGGATEWVHQHLGAGAGNWRCRGARLVREGTRVVPRQAAEAKPSSRGDARTAERARAGGAKSRRGEKVAPIR